MSGARDRVARAKAQFEAELERWAKDAPLLGAEMPQEVALERVYDAQRALIARALEVRAVPEERIEYLLSDLTVSINPDDERNIIVDVDPEVWELFARPIIGYDPGQAPV